MAFLHVVTFLAEFVAAYLSSLDAAMVRNWWCSGSKPGLAGLDVPAFAVAEGWWLPVDHRRERAHRERCWCERANAGRDLS